MLVGSRGADGEAGPRGCVIALLPPDMPSGDPAWCWVLMRVVSVFVRRGFFPEPGMGLNLLSPSSTLEKTPDVPFVRRLHVSRREDPLQAPGAAPDTSGAGVVPIRRPLSISAKNRYDGTWVPDTLSVL